MGNSMDKVKVTIEYKSDKQEFECDVVLVGGANIDHGDGGLPRIAVRGTLTGTADLLSLNRIYASIGNEVHKNNIKQAYGMSKEEAIESLEDIIPKVEKMEDNLLDKTLEELDVSVRAYNCLKRAGIDSVGYLVKMSEDDLCQVRNMGRKRVEEIVWKLGDMGLCLKQEENHESKTTPEV